MWAMDAGADVCVVSVHKMGTGFEQGSVFHRQGDLVDPDQLSACADMLMTTSPNVMVYAALDGWRRQMVQHGHQLLGAALTLAGRVRQNIDALPGLHVLREEFLGAEASHDLDPLHVVIDVSDLGVTGYDAADWLRGNHRLDMGLSDRAPGLPAQRRQRGHATPRRRRSRPRHDQGRQPALTAISGTGTGQVLSSAAGPLAPPTDCTGQRIETK
jgi:Orn/Lys/Arg decarboxylase, major domain